ncbi:uncharacterized protein FIBRA_07808 [Fibroporia radiculosa]|uniref:Uncharacterized protein n=1 Tax=Fibroporia radiculosa TaxID=599839 RepID=J4IC07_9APHY|nr:uncharacterized protein FIBRA_07808 [Fibroporia radiculosa]CCM05581.1 predicted protein [Fibroporia radiculosa]
MPALFPPPPFTPSHPIFAYISTIAVAESEKLRHATEQYLVNIAEEKAAEIRAAEVDLRKKVELLWLNFKEGLGQIQQDGMNGRSSSRRPSNARWNMPVSPGQEAASVRINHFIPTPNVQPRPSSSASQHVVSALSASVVSTSFHYPEASERQTTDPASPRVDPHASSPSRSSATRVSTSSASSRTLAMGINGESSNIRDAYRRNMDQSVDIATSFKYVLDLEEQTKPLRKRQADRVSPERANGHASTSDISSRDPPPKADESAVEALKKENAVEEGAPVVQDVSADQTNAGPSGKEAGLKSKRKVTFDVKPDIAIIDADATQESDDKPPEQDAIFDMEGEEVSKSANVDVNATRIADAMSPPAQELEFSRPSARRGRSKVQDNYGLPSSLASLRPSSLPNMSMRPPRHGDIDDRVEPHTDVASPTLPETRSSGRDRYQSAEDRVNSPDPREAEILRLVAAGTPSHRHAWKRDSKAWQLFVNRQDRRSKEPGPVVIEEEEEGDSVVEYDGPRLGRSMSDSGVEIERRDADLSSDPTLPIASSLPIPMMRNGNDFGLSSYQPKTSLTDRPGMLVPALRLSSSVAMRQAVYAERDRNKPIDPGALDFTDTNELDDEEDVDDEYTGSIGRRRALQILKARSKLPDDGMWRSLA